MSLNQLAELMNAKNDDNCSAVGQLMKQIINSDYSLNERKNLLLAKNHTLMPGLMSALLDSKCEIVNAYVTVILESDLVLEDVKELLLINDKFQQTAHHLLYQSLINDYYQLVYFYVNEILDSDSDDKTKKMQLALNQPFGTPGLYVAMTNGSYQAVKTYIELIKYSQLSEKDKIELILAKNFDGMNAISAAIRNNQHQVVALYFDQIEDFYIPELDIISKLYYIYDQMGKSIICSEINTELHLDGVLAKFQGNDYIVSTKVKLLLERLSDERGYFNLQDSNSDLILLYHEINKNLNMEQIVELYSQVN
ncbi:hypothetical protein L3V83_05025 [Thiotrichales bacterium 19X7-9]|nr:hypothetical protein [Thiotrichales bacterium 19X7-9]